jgi:ribosomal protein S18 acetylase RimI-like enzyme
LVTEVDALHTDAEPHYFRDPGIPARPRDYFESLLKADDKAVFLAELDGQVAGYLHVETREVGGLEVLVPMHYAHVADIVVAKRRQRKGVGKALMAHAESWARQRGLPELRLSVRGFNAPALAFYESLGMGILQRNMGKRL